MESNDLKVGDFFVQNEEGGAMLRRVFSDEEYSISMMYDVFDKHGYYPISESTAKDLADCVKLILGVSFD